MSAGGLCKRIASCGYAMLERGHVLDAQSHAVSEHGNGVTSLMWVRDPDVPIMIPARPRVDDYMAVLRNRNYSFLMHDASIVRIQYVLDANKVVKHCLSYWPAPFEFDQHAFSSNDPVIDVIEYLYVDRLRENLVLVGHLRFDYDPQNADVDHPSSHVTFNCEDCRIPVHAPLSFDTFMRFILENFQKSVWRDETIKAHLKFQQETSCLDETDRNKMHLYWEYI